MAGLPRGEQELLLTGGLDLKEHEQAEGPSGFRVLDGYRFGQLGKLERTPATSSTAVATGTVHTLAARDNDVIFVSAQHGVGRLVDGTTALCTSPATAGSSATSGAFSTTPIEVSRQLLATAQFGVQEEYVHTAVCAGTANGNLVFAWSVYTSGAWKVRMRAVTADGTVIAERQVTAQGDSGGAPVIGACQYLTTGAVVTYSDATAAPFSIKLVEWVDSSRSFQTAVTLTSTAGSDQHRIRYHSPSGTAYLFGYYDNSGSAILNVRTYTSIQVVASTHTASHTATDFDLVVGATQSLVVSIYSSNVIGEVLGTPGTTYTTMTPGTGKAYSKITACQKDDDDIACIFVMGTDTNVSAQDFVDCSAIDFASSMFDDFSKFTTPNTSIIAGAFTVGGKCFCPLTTGRGTAFVSSAWDTSAAAIIIARLGNTESRLDPAARIMHDRAFKQPIGIIATSAVSVIDGVAHIAAVGDPAADGVPSDTTTYPQSVFWNKLNFSPSPLPWQQHDSTTLIAGGSLFDHDGMHTTEAQPLRRPACYIGTPGTTISVVALYTWVDRAGKLHRSAPSDAILVDATDTFYVEIPAFTGRNSAIAAGGYSVEVYCTESGPGSLYYLANNSNKKDDYDSTTTGGMHYAFTSIAAGSTGDPPLYTDSGELSSEPPPSFCSIATVGDRMFGVDAEDRSRWWCTKPFVSGYAPEWNSALTGDLGAEAVAVIDVQGVPTFLCDDGIYQLYGEGPNALGFGSFAPPRKVIEIGCSSRASIADTPVGLFFQSARGFVIWNGQIQEVGLPIEPDTNARTFTCLRAVYDPANHEIRVQGADAIYYYSIANNAWSQLTLTTSEVDTVIINDLIYRSTGTSILTELRRGDSGYNQRSGDSIWETPWIKLTSLNGYGRLWSLLLSLQTPSEDLSSNLTITITLYPDYDINTVATQWEYSGANLADWITDGVVWLPLKPARQRVTAYKLHCEVAGSLSHSGVIPLAVLQEYGVTKRGRQIINNVHRVNAAQPDLEITSPS